MSMKLTFAISVISILASAAQAQDNSALIVGKSAFGSLCATCHGADSKGGSDLALLFQVPPPDLTKLSERGGGKFPFADVYHIIVNGMEAAGHGDSKMPIWGDYFMADALEDRGISKGDAVHISQGRILSLTYFLESIQE